MRQSPREKIHYRVRQKNARNCVRSVMASHASRIDPDVPPALPGARNGIGRRSRRVSVHSVISTQPNQGAAVVSPARRQYGRIVRGAIARRNTKGSVPIVGTTRRCRIANSALTVGKRRDVSITHAGSAPSVNGCTGYSWSGCGAPSTVPQPRRPRHDAAGWRPMDRAWPRASLADRQQFLRDVRAAADEAAPPPACAGRLH